MVNTKEKFTVHIADDHQIIIDGLVAILELESDIEVVGYSLNGSEVLEWFQNHIADILLLDLNMPIVTGIEVLHRFKDYETVPHVIILSSHDDIKVVKDVLKLGAKSFLPKKSAGEHIVKAVHQVIKGEQYFTDDLKEKIMNSILSNPKPIELNNETALIDSLTNREYEILKLISLQYTTKKIGEILFISTSTVETHRKNLLKKLKVKNSVGLALVAIKNNII